ncbi:MAG: fibrillarin-like rRNA/tRNA 2'-O-methyltransferase [Candidatus Micrarchaeota archaeon]|nr:fibrillarin-like rRNA/tRNA 2'-O-methyltransferase [Candidatus Micrarchaeota archaeon]
MVTVREIFPGVFMLDNLVATLNANPGKRVYDERLTKIDGKEYRYWDPFRSKLAGAIKKGLHEFPFTKDGKILYLGASTGTTVSHLSDIVGEKGEIYAIEVAMQVIKRLIELSDHRSNIIPIHDDANQPNNYKEVGEVDAIYQDVAQPNQVDILIKNCDMFLKKDGIAMIAIKSQSIDVTKRPDDVFEFALMELEKYFEILEKYKLEPFDKDHLFVVLRKK